jgi:hypothetical protein
MADQSSIWKKELSLGRNKPAAPPDEFTESVWKKEIRLGRRNAPAPAPVAPDDVWSPAKRVEQWMAPRQPKVDAVDALPLPAAVEVPAAEPVAEVAVPADAVAAKPPRSFAALDPRFRQITVLAKLAEERAAEYPGRIDEWRQMLPRLAEQAVDGVLPVSLEGVVRTLFYELLFVGPSAPNGVERTFETPPPQPLEQSKPIAEQSAESTPAQAVKPEQSGLRRELHLPRPKLPKRSRTRSVEVAVEQDLEPAVKPEQSGLRRELHLPRPKLSRGARAERPAKAEKSSEGSEG